MITFPFTQDFTASNGMSYTIVIDAGSTIIKLGTNDQGQNQQLRFSSFVISDLKSGSTNLVCTLETLNSEGYIISSTQKNLIGATSDFDSFSGNVVRTYIANQMCSILQIDKIFDTNYNII